MPIRCGSPLQNPHKDGYSLIKQKVENLDFGEKANRLVKLSKIATSSLKDYRDEDRTYRVDAKAMIDIIALIEEIEASRLKKKETM